MSDWVTEETKHKLYSDIKGLKSWIVRDLKKLNILRPTPVQFSCVPPAMAGKDIIGGAKTGSGKTLAFVLPILNKLSDDPYGIFALVLTPTRELAFQIGDQFRTVGASMRLRASVIVGGQNRLEQCQELAKEPHVVIATPGRLYDILSYEKDFTLKKIKFLVMDEADRLLDGRFNEQLSVIMEALPTKRQTLLFSATITEQIDEMQKYASSDIFKWESGNSSGENVERTNEQLDEYYTLVNPKVRDASLVAYLLYWREQCPDDLAIVFVDTCILAEALGMTLHELDIPCVTLHSMKTQKNRLEALSKFKSSQSKLMIATDLASRGLDIPLVSLVINHRIPNHPKTYIHRVGRTARAGRNGTALTILTPEDQNILMHLEAVNPQKLKEYKVDQDIVRRIMKQVNITKREQELKLEESGFQERRIIAKRKELILQGKDPDEEIQELQTRIRIGQEKRRKKFLKGFGADEKPEKLGIKTVERKLFREKKNMDKKFEKSERRKRMNESSSSDKPKKRKMV